MNARLLAAAIVSLPFSLAALSGCGGSSSSTPAGAPAATTDLSWRLEQAPEGDRGVAAVKQDAKEGDRVVVRGRIGGRGEPMSAESAVFVMMDPSIPTCADNPEDKCPRPWDYCCEPREVIAANSATVEVLGDAGAPLAIDLSKHGLKPMDEVVVVGVVGPRPDPAVLTIAAEGIYRVGGGA